MWEKALELASHITHPYSVAAFALVFAAIALLLALKAKKTRLAWFLAFVLLAFGLSPLAASTYLASRGVYHFRIVVLGPDGQPMNQADLSASAGGEFKQANRNWEFDLPPQTKPSDSKITFFASVKDAYLSGHSTLALTENYYPAVTIQLERETTATIRGNVVDEKGRSVAGARVSIPGYSEIATTDKMGNFFIAGHAAEGQLVSVRAEYGGKQAEVSVIAGKIAELILRKR
jgi:hypothetical protein